jgi:uncharacterized protein (DUF1697 family)
MPNNSTRAVALLRGINVGGNKKIPMAELRVLATGLGYRDIATYIQSGNLVVTASGSMAEVESALEAAIHKRFGFAVEVIVRTAAQWLAYVKQCPSEHAKTHRPALLLLGVAKKKVLASCIDALAPYCKQGEIVSAARDAIWIDYVTSVGSSKLSPSVIDRAVGSTVTARNWRTVEKLADMLTQL